MDNSIQSFLHGGQRLSVDLLLHCLQQLKLVFGNKGFLSNEDVAQTVTAVASDLPFNDLQVYISLLCDSLPLGENYSALFEFLEDSQRFLMSISNTLYNYSEGYNYPAIRYFQEDVYAMFPAQQSQNYQSNSSYYNDYGSNQSVGSHHSNHMNNGHRYQQQGMNPGHRGNFQRRQMYNQHMPQHDPNMRHFKNKNGSNEDFGKALQRIALEKQPSICRLQALLRKNGMEIIFPQAIHDTVLACVYAAMQVVPKISHRQLLHMILTAQQTSPDLTDIQHLSKSKIRGIVSLLKSSQLLVIVESSTNPSPCVSTSVSIAGVPTSPTLSTVSNLNTTSSLGGGNFLLPPPAPPGLKLSASEGTNVDQNGSTGDANVTSASINGENNGAENEKEFEDDCGGDDDDGKHDNPNDPNNLLKMAAQLSFPSNIQSFLDLRKHHDTYFIRFLTESKQHVILSNHLLAEIIWPTNLDANYQQKLTHIHELIEKLKDFYKNVDVDIPPSTTLVAMNQSILLSSGQKSPSSQSTGSSLLEKAGYYSMATNLSSGKGFDMLNYGSSDSANNSVAGSTAPNSVGMTTPSAQSSRTNSGANGSSIELHELLQSMNLTAGSTTTTSLPIPPSGGGSGNNSVASGSTFGNSLRSLGLNGNSPIPAATGEPDNDYLASMQPLTSVNSFSPTASISTLGASIFTNNNNNTSTGYNITAPTNANPMLKPFFGNGSAASGAANTNSQPSNYHRNNNNGYGYNNQNTGYHQGSGGNGYGNYNNSNGNGGNYNNNNRNYNHNNNNYHNNNGGGYNGNNYQNNRYNSNNNNNNGYNNGNNNSVPSHQQPFRNNNNNNNSNGNYGGYNANMNSNQYGGNSYGVNNNGNGRSYGNNNNNHNNNYYNNANSNQGMYRNNQNSNNNNTGGEYFSSNASVNSSTSTISSLGASTAYSGYNNSNNGYNNGGNNHSNYGNHHSNNRNNNNTNSFPSYRRNGPSNYDPVANNNNNTTGLYGANNNGNNRNTSNALFAGLTGGNGNEFGYDFEKDMTAPYLNPGTASSNQVTFY